MRPSPTTNPPCGIASSVRPMVLGNIVKDSVPIPRIRQDKPFRMALFEAMSTRLSQFRGKFKVAAASKLSASYHLGNASAESIQKVNELLYHKCYIYPGEILDRDTFAPEIANKHPIIADVIKEVLMLRRKCFIIKYARSFTVKWQGAVVFELPKPVIALAAAAVEAALVDFKSELFHSSKFLADSFDFVYDTYRMEMFDNTIGCNSFMPDNADAKAVLADVGLRREASREI
ncbi:hypothetical protein BC629DRAFT_1598963 [Irpex lacteus]|nr:hypothetical protein BC629DRAFT_1598963 [Irpex lacteus]